jgi:FkbM family methyltransferase
MTRQSLGHMPVLARVLGVSQCSQLWSSLRRKLLTFVYLLQLGDVRRICWLLFRRVLQFPGDFLIGKATRLAGDCIRLDACRFFIGGPFVSASKRSALVFGVYERSERDAVNRFLSPDYPVIELGAGIGVVSCISNKRLSNPTAHIVVEANPKMIPLIEHNKTLNQCDFRILHAAILYTDRLQTMIHPAKHFDSTSVFLPNRDTGVGVATMTLRQVVDIGQFTQFVLICDVEGSEIEIIKNEIDLLKQRTVMIIVELHPHLRGTDTTDETLDLLRRADFNIVYSDMSVYTLLNGNIQPAR